MNVGELKNLLSQYPDDMPILLSTDSEGNAYSPLSDGGESLYVPGEHKWYVEQIWMTHKDLDEEIAKNKQWGYTEEDRAPDDAISALVLWPLN